MIIPVILSGGAGTRLWPLSTEAKPKQFLNLWNGKTLFQETVLRVTGDAFSPPVIICNIRQKDLVLADLHSLGVTKFNIVLEPDRRDSAAAIAAASVFVEKNYGPNHILAVLPSDHRMNDIPGFHKKLFLAAQVAQDHYLVTFALTPTRPATEFGYIERGEKLDIHGAAFKVCCFHEKPDLETAARYVSSGDFGWNSGMFVFTPATFRVQAERHMPDILGLVTQAVENTKKEDHIYSLEPEAFSKCRKISIDYALFEPSQNVAVVPADFNWSDVGNWSSVYQEMAQSHQPDVSIGNVKTHRAKGNLVISETLPVRVLGLNHIAVIVTQDGILVTSLEDATHVKDVL